MTATSEQAVSGDCSSAGASPVVTVRGLTKHFGGRLGRLPVLDGVDLTVKTGEYASLIGPSGCGKSTVLRVISGLAGFDKGEVSVLGQPVNAPRPDVAFMFQSLALLPWRSVLDNVLLPTELAHGARQDSEQRARGFLEMVGLSGFERHRPNQLSGGMRQRAALARVLMQEQARLWLLDEPLSALDELTRESMDILFSNICEKAGIATLMVTHSVSEAVFMSDRVFVLSARPARVVAVVDVPLPRPRTRQCLESADLYSVATKVRRLLQGDLP